MKKAVFFIDVDNTLLDNDLLKTEIKKSLVKTLGEKETDHFWNHYLKIREDTRIVDFPNTVRDYCQEYHKDTCELTVNSIFNNIDFKHTLYTDIDKIINHLKTLGRVVLFSEGDKVYQKRKIELSSLSKLADEVLLFEQKILHTDEMLNKYSNYEVYFIDDKATVLIQIKKKHPEVKTIEVLQGHWARKNPKSHKKIDFTLNSIQDLLDFKI